MGQGDYHYGFRKGKANLALGESSDSLRVTRESEGRPRPSQLGPVCCVFKSLEVPPFYLVSIFLNVSWT